MTLRQLALVQRYGCELTDKGVAVSEAVSAMSDIWRMPLGGTAETLPARVLLPLAKLDINLQDLLDKNDTQRIISTADLQRRLGGAVRRHHMLALNRLTLALRAAVEELPRSVRASLGWRCDIDLDKIANLVDYELPKPAALAT